MYSAKLTKDEENELNQIMKLLKQYKKAIDKKDYTKREEIIKELRVFGEKYNDKGGMTAMLKIGYAVQGKNELLSSYLNNSWNRIGNWRA